MSRKHRELRKARDDAKDERSSPSTASAAVKRRRNRRLIFVALLALLFPILELIAYQFRAITMTITNKSKEPIKNLKVSYPGGAFDAAELKVGGSITRIIRPDFSFQGEKFATYPLQFRFASPLGLISQIGRIGSIDFSARETFTIESMPTEPTPIQVKHTSSPGFPLSLIRDLLDRLGIG